MVPHEQAAFPAGRSSAAADGADVVATRRDDAASDRELVSEERDRAAEERDRVAAKREFVEGPGSPAAAAAILQAAEVRAQAAADRALASDDRRQAAVDRDHAATDRRDARAELARAHTDDLTGAYRRGAGDVVLEHELARARRSGESLVVAYVDVDGLKATNDRDGHAAGDARLRDVVNAMRSKLRSYEPIVRYGGDEFVCSILGVERGAVQARFDEIGRELGTSLDQSNSSVSVGLAEMRTDDTLDDLVRRADDALVEKRGDRGRFRRR